MATISAKFNPDEARQLGEICEILSIDKSEALRRATHQLWLALQIGKPFVERAGGRPQFLLESGNRAASSRAYRKQDIDGHLQKRAGNRKTKTPKRRDGGQ